MLRRARALRQALAQLERRRNPRAEAEAKAITRHLVQLGEVSWVQALDFLAQLEGKNVVHWNTVISACGKARQWAAALAVLASSPVLDPIAVASALGARPPWRSAVQLLGTAMRRRLQSDVPPVRTSSHRASSAAVAARKRGRSPWLFYKGSTRKTPRWRSARPFQELNALPSGPSQYPCWRISRRR
ncbi:unnamed protein product [Durusdinium trenchii]|uniref:Uncharacterized protein n=1 Tax=Durusdinium trenchii TaxID=1381693 RepID=A0ABP0LQ23_9DINO